MQDSRRNFDSDSVFELQASLSLWHVKRQSLILDAELVATLAPFLEALELKVSLTK